MRSRRVATQPMWRPWLRTGIRLIVSTRPWKGKTRSVRARVPSKMLGEPAGVVDVGDQPARGVWRDAEKVRGLVVDHGDPPVEVDGEHALLDAVQQGLPLLDEPGDLARLEAEGLALDPAARAAASRATPSRLAMPR